MSEREVIDDQPCAADVMPLSADLSAVPSDWYTKISPRVIEAEQIDRRESFVKQFWQCKNTDLGSVMGCSASTVWRLRRRIIAKNRENSF